MLTTYQRKMDEYRRKVRLEAALAYRESDRRDQAEVLTWTRAHDARPPKQALRASLRGMEGM